LDDSRFSVRDLLGNRQACGGNGGRLLLWILCVVLGKPGDRGDKQDE
jgi:hypothetical protein